METKAHSVQQINILIYTYVLCAYTYSPNKLKNATQLQGSVALDSRFNLIETTQAETRVYLQ